MLPCGPIDDEAARIQHPHICPDLIYHDYKDALKTAATHFGLPNARFTTHDARIGTATAQLIETKDIGASMLADG